MIYGEHLAPVFPGAIISEDHARLRHETFKHYSALFGDPMRPTMAVTVNTDAAAYIAMWLNSEFWHELTYSFKQYKEEEPMFLREVKVSDRYSSGKVRENRVFLFNRDGSVKLAETWYDEFGKEVRYRIWRGQFEANTHWEEVPKFGEYDKLLIRDRPYADVSSLELTDSGP
jgi:hypothetical protein